MFHDVDVLAIHTLEARSLSVVEIFDSPISVWLDIVSVLSAWMAAYLVDTVVGVCVLAECAAWNRCVIPTPG